VSRHRTVSLLLSISLFALPLTVLAASPQDYEGPLLNGFSREIAGEQIGYHSFHPYATTALLTRCLDGRRTITWETAPIPADTRSEFVTFVWIAAHSTGSSRADAGFHVALNGRKWLTFTTVKEQRVRHWTKAGEENVRLTFDAQWEDTAHDLFGFAFLTVPVRAFPKGQPLTVSITGDSTNNPDWYMTFRHALRESLAVKPEPALVRTPGGPRQLVDVMIDHFGTGGRAELLTSGHEPVYADLNLGFNRVQVMFDAVKERQEAELTVRLSEHPEQRIRLTLDPVLYREFWLIPHSHNDIGYSDLQADVEKKQLQNLRDAMRLFRETADYPEEARFKWNTEILWAVESFLSGCTQNELKEFGDVVREGGIGLNALYANQLTGICRPEEMLRLTDCARQLETSFGVNIDDAMITDIPGSTWATVDALAQAGIRYFSSGPNLMPFTPILGDRVGHFNLTWADKPFYWTSPSGKEKLLFWVAGKGYSWFADWIMGRAGANTANNLFDYLRDLEQQKYPYDMVQLRYTIAGDNGPVDPGLPAFVKAWNEHYTTPKLIIATSSRMFHEFERRWGKTLPALSGDMTPYWEDGALSTLRELGTVRRASERLVQTEILACMRHSRKNIRDELYNAWRYVALFDEHTWGAHNSIGEPESPFVISQWNVKRQYALDAEQKSVALMSAMLGSHNDGPAVEVMNTSSWRRTDLVTLSPRQSKAGDRVVDDHGAAVPSQRLKTGELVFLARDVPEMGGKRFWVRSGKAVGAGDVSVAGTVLRNSAVSVSLDVSTGTIRSLKTAAGRELVDSSAAGGLNRYLYVAGFNPAAARGISTAKIEVVERGPLFGKVRITSEAPGTKSLLQEISLVHGSPRVDICNIIDKLQVRKKEGVHVAFPFNVPGGAWRMDGSWGIVRPELDQLPGSCKDFFSTGRWIDISNKEYGVTLTVDESPLVELGTMTDETPSSKLYRIWRTSVAPGGMVYSYVMNNYWHTNYAASQEGKATLHYSVIPHDAFGAVAAYKTGLEQSQPLLVRQGLATEPASAPLFQIDSPDIVATSLMPSVDGKAVMVRLYNAGEKPETFGITWRGLRPASVFVSSLGETAGAQAGKRLSLPPFGILTLRCER
jgi:alpha-mannosidase